MLRLPSSLQLQNPHTCSSSCSCSHTPATPTTCRKHCHASGWLMASVSTEAITRHVQTSCTHIHIIVVTYSIRTCADEYLYIHTLTNTLNITHTPYTCAHTHTHTHTHTHITHTHCDTIDTLNYCLECLW